jgi:hypothetical protein
MEEQIDQQGQVQAEALAAAAPDVKPGPKGFVPFFNEEYEFKLGGLGDVGIAARLGAIFVFMLLAAALMYMGAWWWVGTHPLANNQ